MAITKILTRTDGSAGGQKVDPLPRPNRVNYLWADEINNIADAVVAMNEALGLSDGSTDDSIMQKLLSFGGLRGNSFALADDFVNTFVDTASAPIVYQVVAAGTAAVGHSDSGAGTGVGILTCTAVAGVGSSALVRVAEESIRGTHYPDLRFRFKTPATLADVDVYWGLSNSAGTSYARLRCLSGNTRIESASATGGANTQTVIGALLVGNTWYEGRIVVAAGSVKFYLNDVLIGTITSATSLLVAGDTVSPFCTYILRNANGPHITLVDWYELRGTRL